MKLPEIPVVYWDTSAIVSVLTPDAHHEEAKRWYESEGIHLVSSLCYAEALDVLSRLEREEILDNERLADAYQALNAQPWRLTEMNPRLDDIASLATKWPLRGADLWHLSLAVKLKREFPELALLTFDNRLRAAAEGEGLFVA